MKKRKLLILCAFSLLLFTSCKIDRGTSITAVGSSAMQPLAETCADEYQNNHPGEFVNVQGGGSGTGLSQVQSGAVEIGNSDLFAEEKDGIDADKLVDHKVAVVGITPIVNKKVGVENVTMAELRQIFAGKITNWQELGGSNTEIVLLNRASGSGTRFTFEQWVMNGTKTKKSQEQDSTGMVRQIVAETPGAISYVAFSYVTEDVATLSIDSVQPVAANVLTNDWPIWSYEHMYTKGEAKGLTKDFINYVLSEDIQTRLMPKLGYISVHNMQVERDATGKVTEK